MTSNTVKRLGILAVVVVLAFVPLLWGHDAIQFAFCGILLVVGLYKVLTGGRKQRR